MSEGDFSIKIDTSGTNEFGVKVSEILVLIEDVNKNTELANEKAVNGNSNFKILISSVNEVK